VSKEGFSRCGRRFGLQRLYEGEGFGKAIARQGFDFLKELFFEGHSVSENIADTKGILYRVILSKHYIQVRLEKLSKPTVCLALATVLANCVLQ
jgi:hypothetical protein